MLELDTPLCDFAPELKELYPEMITAALSPISGYTSTDESYPFMPAKPLFKEGEAFCRGEALNMMSYALTRAAGEPLQDIFKRRIADPIGMDRLFFWGDFGMVHGVRVNGAAEMN